MIIYENERTKASKKILGLLSSFTFRINWKFQVNK